MKVLIYNESKTGCHVCQVCDFRGKSELWRNYPLLITDKYTLVYSQLDIKTVVFVFVKKILLNLFHYELSGEYLYVWNKIRTGLWIFTFFSVLWNCCLGWSNLNEKILKVQKAVLRIISLSPPTKSWQHFLCMPIRYCSKFLQKRGILCKKLWSYLQCKTQK